jgi:beta-galactosidase
VTLNATIDGNDVTWNLKNWAISTLPDSYADAVKALDNKGGNWSRQLNRAGYYRGYFNLKKTGDTFINMEAFGKGQVYVNGHAIGRFWNIGPQQTLYLPGCC